MPVVSAAASVSATRNNGQMPASSTSGNPHDANIISQEILYEIPAPEDRVFSGRWEKKAITSKGMSWQPKFAVLTESILGFAKILEGQTEGMQHWLHSKKLSAKEWELERVFRLFDANNNGTLDIMECRSCLEHLKLYSDDEDIVQIFDVLDRDGSGHLDMEEFKHLSKWAHIMNHVVEYIPLQEITSIQYDIVQASQNRTLKGSQEKKEAKAVEEQDSRGIVSGCLAAIEGLLGMDIDGDGHDEADKLPPWDEDTHEFHLIIMTSDDGHNSGKTYVHRVQKSEAQAWYDVLKKTTRQRKAYAARKQLEEQFGHSRWTLVRALTNKMYHSNAFQYSTAAAILMAFTLDICESQILPDDGSYGQSVFMSLDATLTAVFTAELLINIFAHSNDGFRPFYTRGWNWFDTFIVVISLANVILSYSGTELPNAKLLRLLRLGRAVRLFSALKDLQRLIAAVSVAIYPVCNAFLILLIVASMYAILATTFFRDRAPEYFDDFATSLFTMFQVLSGDSWASGISRSLFAVEGGGAGKTDPGVAFFFVSYILINSIMLLNVVVAVLLDEFISSVTRAKEEEKRLADLEIQKRKVSGCLDPLTSELITFADDDDLQERIDIIWTKLDVDNDGALGYEEFQVNINELHKAIHVTRDDFDIITDYGKHLGPTAEFDKEQFREMMNGELWRYSRRQLDNVLSLTGDEQFLSTILMLKIFEAQTRKDMGRFKGQLAAIMEHLGIAHTSACITPVSHTNLVGPSHPPSARAGAAASQWLGSSVAGTDPVMMLSRLLETIQSAANKLDQVSERTDSRFDHLAEDIAGIKRVLESGTASNATGSRDLKLSPSGSGRTHTGSSPSETKDTKLSGAEAVLVASGKEQKEIPEIDVNPGINKKFKAGHNSVARVNFLEEVRKARSFSLSHKSNKANGSPATSPPLGTKTPSPQYPELNLWASMYNDSDT